MTEQRDSNGGWLARWSEHRRVKRQEARDRAYLAQELARSYGGPPALTSYGTASGGLFVALGSDGGGDGGGGGW